MGLGVGQGDLAPLGQGRIHEQAQGLGHRWVLVGITAEGLLTRSGLGAQ
jgi:hypothetical protein